MSPAVMDAPVLETPRREPMDQPESEVARIISRARAQRLPMTRALLPGLVTGLLLWLSFTPVDFGPLAWVALVPLLMLVRMPEAASRMSLALWLCGAAHWLATLQWMRLGDPTMYIAWGVMSLYLACYWPLFVGLARGAVHRLGMPLIIAAPVIWTGLEYLRAHLFTGFAWYLLGHSQHNWVEMIQISDLVGGYGVTFVVMAANACAAMFIPEKWFATLGLMRKSGEPDKRLIVASRQRAIALTCMVVLVGSTAVYGYVRRGQAEFTQGPRVGIVQGNFPAYVRSDMTMDEVLEEWREIYRTHRFLTGRLVPEQPDLILWPEGMFRFPLLLSEEGMTDKELDEGHDHIPVEQWKNRTTRELLEEMALEANAGLIIGLDAHTLTRDEGYRNYNAAAYLEPGRGLTGRYDKIHRVIFGEYIPLRESFPFLQSLTPYSGDFGIDAGQSVQLFQYKDWTLAPNICFEDSVPHLIRNMVWTAQKRAGKHVDCLVNLSNDGWFHGSSELDQHLITASFRCIETRTPMIRSVNTGISAIIDGDGIVREPDVFFDLDSKLDGATPRTSLRDPKTGRYYRQLNCAQVGNVPLDPRRSLYVAGGDWFAMLCLIGCVATGLHGFVARTARTAASPA